LEKEQIYLDEEFFLSMDIYYPELVFKYNIDTYMSNACIDIYNKIIRNGLSGLVDEYIFSYKQCDGYGEMVLKTIIAQSHPNVVD
jgi:hypothetical protein